MKTKPVESFRFHADLALRVRTHKSGQLRVCLSYSGRPLPDSRDWLTDKDVSRLILWLKKYLAFKGQTTQMVSRQEIVAHINAVVRAFDEQAFG